jgi:4-hydroxy-tetrahydrodipicolinate synthase
MSAALAITGVFCATATPVATDGRPDADRLAAHCHWLLEEGCHGIAVLGTTGEANSFSSDERRALLEGLIACGIAPGELMPGTGSTAIAETVALTRHALDLGISRVVMLPPYYYKGVSEDGLFAAYAETIERLGDDRLRIVLYHIPQMSGVPITLGLIERLIAAYPRTVVGVKDSSGEFDNMKAMLAAFPGFSVLVGADPLLLPLLEAGGAGCITATSNLVARSLRTVFDGARDETKKAAVAAAQARIIAYRTLANGFGAQIPTIKAMVAAHRRDPQWAETRPPLVRLEGAQRAKLEAELARIDAA